MGKTVLVGLAIGVLASGCHKDAPKLDTAHLPAELHGLLPGVADEAAVTAALPGAERTADKRLGGTVKVELNDEAAISFAVKVANSDATSTEAWLVKLGDVPRVAMIKTTVTDHCTSAIAALGDHVAQGTCGESNRKFGPEEHEMCATTPDGAHEISIECNSVSGNLAFWVRFNDSHSHSTMINRN